LIQQTTETVLATDIAHLDQISITPVISIDGTRFRVLPMRPNVLSARAEQIMLALEAIVGASMTEHYSETDSYRLRENGRNLASLIAKLPGPRFSTYGARVLTLYGAVDDDHWLWDTEPLLRRIGDLGAMAIPVALHPRGMRPKVNGAGIESLCRIGPPVQVHAKRVLTQIWADTRDSDYRERVGLFVAMRRIGITVPPLVSDKRGQMTDLLKDWNDISPQSPKRVCATSREERARRIEKIKGFRRSNLE
jgi:hypothetical protein